MGLPDGWVSDVLPNRKALKILGNGVVPQQAAAALLELHPCDSPALAVASEAGLKGGIPEPAGQVPDKREVPMTDETPKAPTIRRARGRLEELVREVCDDITAGGLTLPQGAAHWTPHRLATAVKDKFPASGVEPSTGAISDTLKRWRNYGFAVVEDDPLAFVEYTEDGRTKGLSALKEEDRNRRTAERRREKEAAKSAAAEDVTV